MNHDDARRRAYWAQQMDEAHQFMMRCAKHPVTECGEPFAPIPDAVEQAGVEALFSDSQVIEGVDRIFYLRRSLIEPLVAVARDMNERGWILKIEDAFRTRRIQKGLARKPVVFDRALKTVLWETEGKTPDPEFMFKRVLALVAYCPQVGTHTSGSAIDISVFNRDDGSEVDRGAPYIELSEKTPMASPFISAEAQANRKAITDLMRRHGFLEYPYEFWHYNQGDVYETDLNGKPARFGPVDFDQATGKLTPIDNPTEPLNSLDEIRQSIEASLARLTA
jgi:D-alanyl-D-alanine dipeptidase